MFKRAALAFSLAALVSVPAGVSAAPCRDAKGKFTKCPTKAAAPAPKRCRDTKGHFAKCGAPGAKPA